MDRIHRSSDLTQTFVFSGFNVSEVANIYFLLLDPVGNIVKQCAIVPETGFPSEDVSVIDESNVEVRLNRTETANLSYGKYTYQVRIAETNAAFEESVSVRSDAYPSLRVVADYEKTKQGENIEVEFTIGEKGETGDSAYEVAILEGFIGTEIEWLASLKGDKGDQGIQGIQGIQGDQGIQGVQGDEGLSAYEVAINAGFVGTEQEWLDSLKGDAAINPLDIAFALSDETRDLTTENDGQVTIIRDQTIDSITFAANVAPVGSDMLVDVLKNGVSILSSALTLLESTTSVTITPPQITSTSIFVGDILKADITQVGATVAGVGAKIYFKTSLA